MNASQQEDFILRQVAAVGVALARIIGLRRAGATGEAGIELQQAYGLLLGSRSDVLRSVDAATAAALLDAPDAILALARLAAEEAEHDDDADRRAALHLRAVGLGIEALLRDETHLEARAFVDAMAPLVDPRALPSEQRGVLDGVDPRGVRDAASTS